MEPIPDRLRILATLKKFKKEIKNGSVMPVHVECAKHTFNVFALLTKKTVIYFSLGHSYSNTTCFSIFVIRNFLLRIHIAYFVSLY